MIIITNDVVHCVSCFFLADGEMAFAPSFWCCFCW